MADVAIAILGLNRVGTSMGLALKRYNTQSAEHQFTITGYDSTSDTSRAAKKMGAIDEIAQRPEMAARGKDIIVLNLPYGEIEAAYDFISQDLRPGAVILDTSPICQTSLEWAKKHLKDDSHVVCIKPILNSKYLFNSVDRIEDAAEDLFDEGTMLLMPSMRCIKEAIALASDFSRILGSRNHFLDPAEHDGLMAGVELLPELLGTVYFHMISNSSGWADMQRITNPSFGGLSHPLFDTHPDDLRDQFMKGSDNLVRYLDEMIAQLREFRKIIADNDRDAVEAALSDASKEYETWINRRHNNRWQDDEMIDSSNSSIGSMMGNMVGGFFGGMRRDKKDDD